MEKSFDHNDDDDGVVDDHDNNDDGDDDDDNNKGMSVRHTIKVYRTPQDKIVYTCRKSTFSVSAYL